MRDQDGIRFPQVCLPRLGLKWAVYRKVHGTVCKRVGLRELGLADVSAYGRAACRCSARTTGCRAAPAISFG